MAESVSLKESCAVHTQRSAVDRCARCGRAACLTCAIPVRGRVLCTECVGEEIGTPVQPRALEPAPARADVATVALFLLGVAASVFPWDRFGDRTGVFSAWNPNPEPWPLLASASLLVGAALAVIRIASRDGRSGRLTRQVSLWSVGAGGLAVVASALAVFAVPGHATRTLAPVVALVAALTATTVVSFRGRSTPSSLHLPRRPTYSGRGGRRPPEQAGPD